MNGKKIIVLVLTYILNATVLHAAGKFEEANPDLVKERGCLACHEGIEQINTKMAFISNMGGIGKGCVDCHEGNANAATKEEAHKGFFPNPGAMWVVSKGLGCAKCHSNEHALNTIMGKDLPDAAGGKMLQIVSTATDPSGATGSNHVYRMQRGLMSLEFGKASHTLMSNGVHEKGDYIFSDFDMDDPDGPVPSAGTPIYKKWIAKAIENGFIKRVEKSKEIPDFDSGMKLWNDPNKAAISDMYRKQCARCHIWEEGRDKRGDHRASGCSACHVLYSNEARYEGNDPTIPKDAPGHPIRHEITLKIPAAQCTHCHTRGKRIGTTFVGAFEYDYKSDNMGMPFNEKGEPQELLFTKDYIKVREDIHFAKGMQCIDCHTSIDVHGDGNIYPSTLYQVEIQCQDCHGTPQKYPWELPIGHGTPVTLEGERGGYKIEGVEYLLTSRGNPRKNLIRNGNEVILTSLYDDKEHKVPILKGINLANKWKTNQGKVAMDTVHQHMDKLECYACHSTWAPQCYGCHTKYDRRKEGTDWVKTALNHDPKTGLQRVTKTKGDIDENRGFMRWEEPILGINVKGKVSPVIPGCQVVWSYVDENGKVIVANQIRKTSDGFDAPTLAPVQPHANTIPARTCESCHTNPKAIGYGTAVSRSQGILEPEKPHFMNNSEGYYGDIQGSKEAKWQVPKILDFPYAWDQLVTRSGKQVQNMPHMEDRPLNEEERNMVEREGLCVACHQHYNTPMWERIRKNLKNEAGKEIFEDGKAITPELHDKAIEALLKAFGEE